MDECSPPVPEHTRFTCLFFLFVFIVCYRFLALLTCREIFAFRSSATIPTFALFTPAKVAFQNLILCCFFFFDLSCPGIGEPPLFLGAAVMMALKDAVYAARLDSGTRGHFELHRFIRKDDYCCFFYFSSTALLLRSVFALLAATLSPSATSNASAWPNTTSTFCQIKENSFRFFIFFKCSRWIPPILLLSTSPHN